MSGLLDQIQASFPLISFVAGTQFCWSPETNEVIYKILGQPEEDWSLLHETGHALLGHKHYKADYELLQMEIAAWERARLLAVDFHVKINEDHIQNCLDTYRDWLYQRSCCPNCATQCLQENDPSNYRCYNCHTIWQVTNSRFARSYRRSKGISTALIFR